MRAAVTWNEISTLLTVSVLPEQRSQVIELTEIFRAKVVDVSPASMLIELAGTEEKIEKFVELMKPFGISEMARTGVIAMARGLQPMRDASNDAPKQRKRSFRRAGPGGAAAFVVVFSMVFCQRRFDGRGQAPSIMRGH